MAELPSAFILSEWSDARWRFASEANRDRYLSDPKSCASLSDFHLSEFQLGGGLFSCGGSFLFRRRTHWNFAILQAPGDT